MKHHDNWCQTYTGKKFSYFHPDLDSVCLEDIAHSLSMQCRFNGHTHTFYSVAEHCWWASHIVSSENALQALMHDAGEAYISDIPKPFKLTLGHYVEWVEQLHLDVIGQKFGFDGWFSDEVKDADVEMLIFEREQALRPTEHKWSPYIENYRPYLAQEQGVEVKLHFWSPGEAKEKFLARFEELKES
jgi:5'-deoxynucleotidase YfbR-like HD superfamily hydrolase